MFESNDRTKHSKVVACCQDKNKARRIAIEADGDAAVPPRQIDIERHEMEPKLFRKNAMICR